MRYWNIWSLFRLTLIVVCMGNSLPPNWSKHIWNGKEYYHNRATGATQWESPSNSSAVQQSPASGPKPYTRPQKAHHYLQRNAIHAKQQHQIHSHTTHGHSLSSGSQFLAAERREPENSAPKSSFTIDAAAESDAVPSSADVRRRTLQQQEQQQPQQHQLQQASNPLQRSQCSAATNQQRGDAATNQRRGDTKSDPPIASTDEGLFDRVVKQFRSSDPPQSQKQKTQDASGVNDVEALQRQLTDNTRDMQRLKSDVQNMRKDLQGNRKELRQAAQDRRRAEQRAQKLEKELLKLSDEHALLSQVAAATKKLERELDGRIDEIQQLRSKLNQVSEKSDFRQDNSSTKVLAVEHETLAPPKREDRRSKRSTAEDWRDCKTNSSDRDPPHGTSRTLTSVQHWLQTLFGDKTGQADYASASTGGGGSDGLAGRAKRSKRSGNKSLSAKVHGLRLTLDARNAALRQLTLELTQTAQNITSHGMLVDDREKCELRTRLTNATIAYEFLVRQFEEERANLTQTAFGLQTDLQSVLASARQRETAVHALEFSLSISRNASQFQEERYRNLTAEFNALTQMVQARSAGIDAKNATDSKPRHRCFFGLF